MRFGFVVRCGGLTVIAASVIASMSGSVIGATTSSATPRRSRPHAQFLVPWTTGRGKRTLGRFVIDGFIGYDLACHGPGRITLRLSAASELASLRCPRSGVITDTGGLNPPRKPRHVVVRITAAPNDHWIVLFYQIGRNSSGTVNIPVGPLNRFTHRY
jgi:hypothetical protein